MFLLVGFAVMAISVEATTKITGTLYSLNTGANTVSLKSGGILSTINLSPKTKFVRNGVSTTLKGLVLGDQITAIYKTSLLPVKLKATGVKVSTVQGSVKNVTSTGSVQVGATKVKTNAQTMIIRNGSVASLDSIAMDDDVVSHVEDSSGEAEDIEVEGPEEAEVRGTVSAVDTTLNTVSVTPTGGGADVTVNVTPDTFVEVSGVTATIADILVGMNGDAEYDPLTMNAFHVEAEDEAEDAEIEGTITAVDAINGFVTITDINSNTVTVGVDAGTQIERDDEPAFLSDLQVNDSAKAEYDVNTNVASEIEADSGI
jgi:hypothetical protein